MGIKDYQIMPLFSDESKDPKTNIPFPPVDYVKEAKDWVDHNEK